MPDKAFALTIDDLPIAAAPAVSAEEPGRIFTGILANLRRRTNSCIGFAVGAWLRRPRHERLLSDFAGHGDLLCNHSHRHRPHEELTTMEFEEEVVAAERVSYRWMKARRYFRFPYLRSGRTPEQRRDAMRVLKRLAYEAVPVTVDNKDWRYDRRYQKALSLHDRQGVETLAAAYLDYLTGSLTRFDELARTKLGRRPRHILVLHMNRINADCLDRFPSWCGRGGWAFVDPVIALEDQLYRMESRYFGERGVSWLYHI